MPPQRDDLRSVRQRGQAIVRVSGRGRGMDTEQARQEESRKQRPADTAQTKRSPTVSLSAYGLLWRSIARAR